MKIVCCHIYSHHLGEMFDEIFSQHSFTGHLFLPLKCCNDQSPVSRDEGSLDTFRLVAAMPTSHAVLCVEVPMQRHQTKSQF